jgi:putative ABC transport system ATP-binding protein
LILADEPTGNLDSATGSEILDVLSAQVAETGAALVMVTHSTTAAERAHRVLHLRDGRLSTDGPAPPPPPAAVGGRVARPAVGTR